jgi:hypothetical protein
MSIAFWSPDVMEGALPGKKKFLGDASKLKATATRECSLATLTARRSTSL